MIGKNILVCVIFFEVFQQQYKKNNKNTEISESFAQNTCFLEILGIQCPIDILLGEVYLKSHLPSVNKIKRK